MLAIGVATGGAGASSLLCPEECGFACVCNSVCECPVGDDLPVCVAADEKFVCSHEKCNDIVGCPGSL